VLKLINGRGQLGNALRDLLESVDPLEETYIYHTWNIDDKDQRTQQIECEKFAEFVDEHAEKKIIFVSTYSEKENWYNYCKQIAEVYLLSHCEKGVVVRLPTLIGKGILQKFKEDSVEAYGEMELMTINDAAIKIIDKVNYNGIIKSFRLKGELIQAKIIKEIILSLNIGE
jgi:dTDP-4-dehydrorhamnose reductase